MKYITLKKFETFSGLSNEMSIFVFLDPEGSALRSETTSMGAESGASRSPESISTEVTIIIVRLVSDLG